MKLSKTQLRRIIRNILKEAGQHYSATEIYMDIVRKGGPDHFCAIAHEKPGMKCTDFMHYEHALRAYIDTEAPHLSAMPNNIWRQIVNLLRDTV